MVIPNASKLNTVYLQETVRNYAETTNRFILAVLFVYTTTTAVTTSVGSPERTCQSTTCSSLCR